MGDRSATAAQMGGTGSADACRTISEHYYVERRPLEHMGADEREFSKCPFAFLHKRFQDAKSQTFESTIAGRPCVFVQGAAGSQLMYDTGHQSHAVSTQAPPECVQALLGKGTGHCSVSLLHGEAFIERKKEVLRAFSAEALEFYWGEIAVLMQKYVDSWLKHGTVSMAKELDDLAFEISARCFIGATDPGHVHKLRTIAGGASVLDVAGDPAVSAAVRDALLEMIDEEMESEQDLTQGDSRHALDFLLEGALDVEDMKVELCHFLLKGRDSLGRALKSFALALAQHADARKGVEEEVAKVGGSLAYSSAGSMVVTGQVIKEVKRLNPLGPLGWRIVTEDIKLGETQISAGTRVALTAMQTHHDAAQYEDAAKFDPSRFGKDRAEDKKNSGWCFVPHGTGVKNKVHRCPAEDFVTQVLKLFALVISSKCSWTVVEGQDHTLDESLTPKDGLMFNFKAR